MRGDTFTVGRRVFNGRVIINAEVIALTVEDGHDTALKPRC